MVRARKPPDGRANNGGTRQGQPGKAYPNRTDMRAQKIQTAPGQEYGKATAQAAAQRAVPMAGPPSAAPPAAAGGAGPAGAGGPGPGDLGPFARPTDRPAEPLTTGIPSGPGAGPEALARPGPDPDLEAMRPYLPTLELLASQPNASPTARMFVRRLRGMMPPPGA